MHDADNGCSSTLAKPSRAQKSEIPSFLTFLAFLNRAHALLELDNVPPDVCGPARPVGGAPAAQDVALAGGLDVEARGEGAVAGAGEDDGTDVRVDGELAKGAAQLEPHGLVEGVELGRAVDLDVGDERGRARDAEVLEARVARELGHVFGGG